MDKKLEPVPDEGGEIVCCGTSRQLWTFAVVDAVLVMFSRASYSYISSALSSMQAVFSLSSTNVGVWYSMFEIGGFISNIYASYFLSKRSIPKVLAISGILCLIGTVGHAVPHFFAKYDVHTSDPRGSNPSSNPLLSVCDSSFRNTTTKSVDTSQTDYTSTDESVQSTVALVVFCLSGLLNGAGYAPFYCLGMSYIDKNEMPGKKSTYVFSVILAISGLGPIIGFAVGSWLLSYHVTLSSTQFTPDDEEWVGAWWLGYFVFGAPLLIISPVMWIFPEKITYNTTRYQADDSVEKECKESKTSLAGLIRKLKGLITNPLYVLETMANCTGLYVIAGWSSYLPKFFEEQFKLSASQASIYGGVIPPAAGVIAIYLGGVIASKRQFTIQNEAKFIFACTVASALLLTPLYFIRCQQYPAEIPNRKNFSSCLADCNCDPLEYSPICYNGVSYKSACLAGCTNYQVDGDKISYSGCLCDETSSAIKGACADTGCTAVYWFPALAILFVSCYVLCSASVVNVVMKAVPEEDRSLALGLQAGLTSVTAWTPAPILYGYLIDTTCRIWEYPNGYPGNPNWKGYCMEYDDESYGYKYKSITLGMVLLSCVLGAAGWWTSYRPRYKTLPDTTARQENKEESVTTHL